MTELEPDARAWRGLGRSFQDARLFPSLTVQEAIAVALERHIEVRDPMAAFLLSPSVKLSERKVAERVDELIESSRSAPTPASSSASCRPAPGASSTSPACSPTSPRCCCSTSPDPASPSARSRRSAPLLLDIRDRTGAAIVIIEHDMPLIAAVSDELVALESGAEVAPRPARRRALRPTRRRRLPRRLGGSGRPVGLTPPEATPTRQGVARLRHRSRRTGLQRLTRSRRGETPP